MVHFLSTLFVQRLSRRPLLGLLATLESFFPLLALLLLVLEDLSGVLARGRLCVDLSNRLVFLQRFPCWQKLLCTFRLARYIAHQGLAAILVCVPSSVQTAWLRAGLGSI